MSRGIPLYCHDYFRGMPLVFYLSHNVEVLRICVRSLPADCFMWSLDPLLWPMMGEGDRPKGDLAG